MKTRLAGLNALARRMRVGMSSLSPSIRKLIKGANAVRDQRDWAMAARFGGQDGQGAIPGRRISVGALRRAGDRARDARRWTEAVRVYEAYLRRVPNDVAMWAQFGHSLKESGDLVGGEAAYRTGLSKD